MLKGWCTHVEVSVSVFNKGYRDRVEVSRFNSKHLYPWSHLIDLIRELWAQASFPNGPQGSLTLTTDTFFLVLWRACRIGLKPGQASPSMFS